MYPSFWKTFQNDDKRCFPISLSFQGNRFSCRILWNRAPAIYRGCRWRPCGVLPKQWRIFGMILYHGTNMDFDGIELSKSSPYKDFGKGFYLTDIRSQAEQLAEKRQNCLKVRQLFKCMSLMKQYCILPTIRFCFWKAETWMGWIHLQKPKQGFSFPSRLRYCLWTDCKWWRCLPSRTFRRRNFDPRWIDKRTSIPRTEQSVFLWNGEVN